QFPNIVTASQNATPYYTNSSHLPVGYTEDVFTALDIQDKLQTLYTSGTVFHCFLGEKMPDWRAASNLVRRIAENYELPYYTMSPTYSVCTDHGYLAGEVYTCPVCGKPTEVYSRITGYYRPVQNWNVGKSEEFKERKTYDIAHSHLTHEKNGADCCCSQAEPLMDSNTVLMMFTTKTCPNCKIAKKVMEDAGINYKVVDAEENPELSRQYGIYQAPTLVLVNNEDVTTLAGVSEIRGYVKRYQGTSK
ncbi:MAG: ribonucleoside triphosphate reductase, partial [Spirochaetales bacterium]|nr:ribonucleoside triphosphate reductase [Spirochaetales bacterium]